MQNIQILAFLGHLDVFESVILSQSLEEGNGKMLQKTCMDLST